MPDIEEFNEKIQYATANFVQAVACLGKIFQGLFHFFNQIFQPVFEVNRKTKRALRRGNKVKSGWYMLQHISRKNRRIASLELDPQGLLASNQEFVKPGVSSGEENSP